MKGTKKAFIASSAIALAVTLAACGGGSGTGTGTSTGDAGGDRIAIGVKFDQPGTTLKVGNDFKGFDADVARYVAKELGYEADKIDFKESISSQRESMIEGDQVKLVVATYSITDARKERVSFAGPYIIAGQDLLVRVDDDSITGPESLNGKKLCSVTGSTPALRIKEKFAANVDLTEMDTYSKCVQALAGGQIDAVTTDDTILAGFAAQSQYAGKLKLVKNTFSEELYGIGLKKGDTETCEKVTAAINKMIDSGEWQKAVDANFGPAGYEVNASVNPPTPDACS